jgi:predicted outer membrane repeat protein
VETLEDRVVPSTWTVENANASGTGSLAAAVTSANSDTSPAIINFDPAVFARATTITLTNTLTLTNTSEPITINGGSAGAIIISGGGASIEILGITSIAATLENLTITEGRTLAEGGGISEQNSNLTIDNCTITGNSASSSGGAIYAQQGTLLIVNSTISNNFAGSQGGAGLDCSDMDVTIIDSTISGNTSDTNGAGISVENGSAAGGPMMLVNCTIADNSSASNGGGIDSTASSFYPQKISLTNCTIADNTAYTAGGGVYGNNTTATFANCIVAGNSTSGGTAEDLSEVSSTFAGSNNLIGNGNGATGFTAGTNGNLVGPSTSPINAMLGSLASNGGPTQTILPQSGSPANGAAAAVTQTGAAVSSTSANSVTIASGSIFSASSLPSLAAGSYFTIQINSEQMNVTAVTITGSSAMLSVARGVDGTTAATHASGASVYLVADERGYLVPAGGGAPTIAMGAGQSTGVTPNTTVTGVTPQSGSTTGGTTVTISGSQFTGVTAVNFGSTTAASFTVVSATEITAVAPAESAGAVDIIVTASAGASAASPGDQFFFTSASSLVVTTNSDAVSHTGTSLRDAIVTAEVDADAGQTPTITFAASLNGQTITLSPRVS